jgi:hypothetical protein
MVFSIKEMGHRICGRLMSKTGAIFENWVTASFFNGKLQESIS